MSYNWVQLRSYIDKALIKADSAYSEFNKNYILSIRLSLDGFSFCITSEDKNKHLALESYLIQEAGDYTILSEILDQLIDHLEILKKRFNKVFVMFEGTKSTLIPSPLFDEDSLEHYLKFNHKVDSDELILFDRLSNLQAYNVFALPQKIKDLISSRFINYKIIHYNSSLIEELLVRHKNQNLTNRVFANVRQSYLDIVVPEGDKIIFHNSFRYKTIEDFAYFLIFVLEQLKLNPESVELVLTGEIDKSSKYYEILYKYIRNIEFIERNDFFKYSYVLDELPSNYFYNLLNVSTCEL